MRHPSARTRAARRGRLATAIALATATGALGLVATPASASASGGHAKVVAVAATDQKGSPRPCHRPRSLRHGGRAASVKSGSYSVRR